jgi:hypothetical protein
MVRHASWSVLIRGALIWVLFSVFSFACTYDTPLSDVHCTGTGEVRENAVCEDGFWVLRPLQADMNTADGNVCVPEVPAEICSRLQKDCGSLQAEDRCGNALTIYCGTCPDDGECRNNICSCVAETDLELCLRNGRTCDTLEGAVDNCANSRGTVECGTCVDPTVCGGGGTPGVCACTSQIDVDFCNQNGARCGVFTGIDLCDLERVVDCSVPLGECSGVGEECTEDNQCVCEPLTESQLCDREGAVCGGLQVIDNCGVSRMVDNCGDCTGTDEECTNNQCVCVRETPQEFCTRNGSQCGTLSAADNCGVQWNNVDCPQCSMGRVCVGSSCCLPQTTAQYCSASGYECGAGAGLNNCGQMDTYDCGPCSNGNDVCVGRQCCSKESDGDFCTRLMRECDSVTDSDNCGVQRTVDCGMCSPPDTCDTSNQCVCLPESISAFCSRVSSDCGQTSGADNCGPRTEDCGSCSGPNHVCDLRDHTCCRQDDNDAFCDDNSAECGSITAIDNCGQMRTVNKCYGIGNGESCGGGEDCANNVCD